jgi:hypothetical protein
MLAAILDPDPTPDPLGRRATEREGAQALLVGLAANRSMSTGAPVCVADLLADAGPGTGADPGLGPTRRRPRP